MKSNSKKVSLDPRVGLVGFLAILVFAAALPAGAPLWKSVVLFSLLLTGGLFFSFRGSQFWKRFKNLVLILLPFLAFLLVITLLFSKEPPGRALFYFGQMVFRALIVVAADLVFILSQKTQDLLAALTQAKLPPVFIQLLNFAIRYSQIFTKEATNSFRARLSREKCRRLFFENLRITGLISERIFWRAIERSERIYAAMLSRGYNGHLYFHQKFRLQRADLVALISLLAVLIFLASI
ncbi:MAG: energy-coupling factor transporter transmembrane component T family protein [Candidatus Saccharicenans sp.]|nr:MAG: hypothetical protein C0168_05700 [Candidatus Aminicenantes bacterium]HEK85321.1 hypothetical protein [Candidatus Aminicenantes bacterium]